MYAALRRPEMGMLGLAALIVLLIAGVSSAHWTHYRRVHRHAVQTEALLEAVEQLLLTLLDAETGQRGFLLMGDERSLGPYTQALESVDQQVRHLTHALAPLPDMGDAGAVLRRLLEHRLALLREMLALYRTHGLSAVQEGMRRGEGQRTMDEVRRRCAALRRTLAAAVQQERVQVEAQAQRLHLVTTGGRCCSFAASSSRAARSTAPSAAVSTPSARATPSGSCWR